MELLERETTLAALDDALRSVSAGNGRVALLYGEAGIGKTSVVRAFMERHSGQARVLWGMCDDLSTPRTLGPLVDIADEVNDVLRASLTGGGSPDEIFGLVLAEVKRPPLPVVFVIEDLHWADDATLDLVIFLSRRIESLPALLLLTYRTDEMAATDPLIHALGRVPSRLALRLELAPLSVAAVARLVGTSAAELHSVTGGNPFYISELLATPGMVPRSVTDAVLARVTPLPAPSRGLLDLIALSPGRVETSLLDACSAGWALAATEPERRGMLIIDRHAVAFRHEIARQAVAATVPATRAAELHRNLLVGLIDAGADPARIVHHAAAADDADALLAYGIEAARRALRCSGNHEAVAHFRRVAPLADRLGFAEQADMYEKWAAASVAAGEIEEAAEIAERAVALRQTLGQVEETARALTYLSRIEWSLGRGAESERIIDEARTLLAELPPGETLAYVLVMQALRAMISWQATDALRLAREAAELAQRCRDESVLAYALMVIGTTNLGQGRDDTASVEQCVELSRARGDHSRVCVAYANLAETAVEQRQHERALNYLDLGRAWADEHEELSVADYLAALRSRLELDRGRWAQAEHLATSVLEQPGGSVVNMLNALYTLSRLYSRRGDSRAESTVQRLVAAAEPTRELQRIVPAALARAEWAELRGHLAAERPALREIYDRVTATGVSWAIGEVALWLSRAGGLDEIPTAATGPTKYELEGRWAEAAAAWEELGCPYEQAAALVHSDDPDAQLAALPLLDALGADAASGRVRSILRSAGLRRIPRGPRQTTRAHPAGLTERQVEVLALLAQGLTNAEIADRLVVSVRTVDHHVAAILDRLAVKSRRQAVDVARELGLALPSSR